MSATTETLTFSIGVLVGRAACTKSETLLAVARAGLQAATTLGQEGNEVELRRAMLAFQAAADSVRADLKAQQRAAA